MSQLLGSPPPAPAIVPKKTTLIYIDGKEEVIDCDGLLQLIPGWVAVPRTLSRAPILINADSIRSIRQD